MEINAPILLDEVSKNRDAFLKLRSTHIGASDVPAILGLNPYQTPLHLWMQKTGRLDALEDNDRLWYGREHEHLVAKLFSRRMDMPVEHVDKVYRHPTIEWLMASPDWIAKEKDECGRRLLECKTVGFGLRNDWSTSHAPDSAHVQLLTQQAVTGIYRGHCCSIVAGNVDNAFFPEFSFDEKLWDVIVSRLEVFHDCLAKDKMPDMQAGDLKLLHELIPATNPESTDLALVDSEGFVEQLVLQKRIVSDYTKGLTRETKRLDELKAKVKVLMGHHQKAHFNGTTFAIQVIPVKGYEVKPRVDTRFNIKLQKETDDE